ncbi:bifunctional diguanylate cyclase/phosphodiesterase [Marinimicrobium alkaliphilum]|uniref:bifunctional diguanylate cyclase/phosphodiesterase n=1 Tax=Marinimicrobium alkaliphilum TaxID=2202654 RepID=UPI000DB9FA08|nr:EAL domain-containing protein [Marinimicrobium alkaliphilum]
MTRSIRSTFTTAQTAWIVAAATFLLTLVISLIFSQLVYRSLIQETRFQAATQAAGGARALETDLRHSLSAGLTLASFVRHTDNVAESFDDVASYLLHLYPNVFALSLSPDGIITLIRPEAGNERALGFNQLADIQQAGESLRALEAGVLSVAGPLELIQGGLGIVGRYPVFLDTEDEPQFWGFTNVTIRLEDALSGAGLDDLQAQGLSYHLWRQHPDTGARQTIAQDPAFTDRDPVTQVIQVPNGTWMLDVHPADGWASTPWRAGLGGLSLVFSAMIAYLFKTLFELHWHKRHLEAKVRQRTRAVSTSLQRFKSLVAASGTGAWEFFARERRLRCSNEYFSLLGLNPADYSDQRDNLDTHWTQLIHPDDRVAATERFNAYLARPGDGMYESKFRMLHADGHWVWVLSRGRTLKDDQGDPTNLTVGTHIDITKQVEDEAKLELAAKVFERGSEGFLITNPEQEIVMVNHAFLRITGYDEDEVIGNTPRMLSSGRHDASFYEAMWDSINTTGVWQGEVWNRRKDGSIYPEWLSISRMTDGEGRVSHYIGIVSDITRLKQDQEQIHQLAYYDPLTSLPNRSLLEERANQALHLAHRSGQSLAMLFLDLDNFKTINDSLGHHVGDELLVAFAQRVQKIIREGDTFARPGGDEFIVLLPDTDANGAAHAAQKILEMLAPPFVVGSYELSITSSVGIAIYPDDGDNLNSLYTNADIAMYRAKQEGRNTYSFFTPELQTHYVRTLELENAMRRALELNQFELHYQPQQCLHTGAIIGLEALLRWTHPTLGRVSPAEFIPIAETSGLILPIGEWVLRTAARQARKWIDQGIAPPKIAINLSAMQFRQPQLAQRILDILKSTELPPEYLELELTESITMDNPEKAITAIEKLHDAGVALSIDDFGTGYSSLSYLKRLKIYKLKIDQSFVRDMTTDMDDRVIISTIIKLSQSLGLRCIAEGVETREQLELLRDMGCQDIQGYYLSRPLDTEAITAFLTRR